MTDTHQSPAEGYAIVTEQEAAIMVGVSTSAVLDGIEAHVVTVEADVAKGIPQFSIVGLPDSAVTESKLRIRAAIRNSGYEFPARRITVNLSPASVRKRGAGLDLAIAIAILRASGQLPPSDQIGFCAELGLSGNLIPVPAIVNLALSLKRHGVRRVMIATQQIGQCLPLPDLTWSTADGLKEVADALTGQRPFREMDVVGQLRDTDDLGDGDFSDVIGLSHIKRAMMVAAVGRHHVMLVGPPGAGKTMLASRFVSILPRLSTDATLEVYTLHQAAGIASPASTCPPVRNPHHTITTTALIGGTAQLIPGEATLAHHGVLILDELLEFSRAVLDSLREPLVSRTIRLARSGKTTILPAHFILAATLNPCPCGQRGFSECRCSDGEVNRYWSRLSGPLSDRVDMVVPVYRETQTTTAFLDSSKTLRATVAEARLLLTQEWPSEARDMAAKLNGRATRSAMKLLSTASKHFDLSRRGLNSVVSTAISVASLEGTDTVNEVHVQEALSYRTAWKPTTGGS